MKRILIITTGGTISCADGENGLSPEYGGDELIGGGYGCETEILDLFSRDSTDITPDCWKRLYQAVEGSAGYDGIVILHGTDTLEYTAAALYFTASHLDIPIILTGSMLPFFAEDSDGVKNTEDAVAAACDDNLKGVYVVFCGRIISGLEAVKKNSREADAFASFGGNDCGYIKNKKAVIIRKADKPKRMVFPKNADKKVAVIKLSPFTDKVYVPENYSAAVIESFGAGGIPQRQELMESVRELARRMPTVMTTPCVCGADLDEYEVGRRAKALGVRDGGKMSTACAAVWLFLEGAEE